MYSSLGTQGDLGTYNEELEKGKDLPREGSMESIDVVLCSAIVESDLPVLVIHVDAYLFRTGDRKNFLGVDSS